MCAYSREAMQLYTAQPVNASTVCGCIDRTMPFLNSLKCLCTLQKRFTMNGRPALSFSATRSGTQCRDKMLADIGSFVRGLGQ